MSGCVVQRFGPNAAGRDIAVGDIHGHFRKLKIALDEIGFDASVDRLFSVGDLVDRGPDSDAALEWLAQPWFHAVRGNHEEMAIDLVRGQTMGKACYVQNGGAWNLSNPRALQVQIADEFAALPITIEVETGAGLVGIVHAECPTHTWAEMIQGLHSESDQEREYMQGACQWGRNRHDLASAQGLAYPVGGVRAVLSGHTPVRCLTWLSNTLMADTGVFMGGAFALVDLATLVEATAPVRRPRDLSIFGDYGAIAAPHMFA